MAFPTGWTKKCSLTINASQVSDADSANLSNFPVLLTEANFPSTAFDNTIDGGADLRFTSDEAGTTELCFEVVNWDTTDDKAEVWVKVPTVDYDDDTVFYVWYGNATAEAYAVDATYGRNNVWADYKGVWHLQGSYDGTAGEVIDSSGNINGVSVNTTTQTAGKISNCQDFNGTDEYLDMGNPTSLYNIGYLTVQCWGKTTGSIGYFLGKQSTIGGLGENFAFGYGWVAGKAKLYLHTTGGSWVNSGDSTTLINNNEWYFVTGVYDGTYARIYVNGNQENSANVGSITIGSGVNAYMYIGAYISHPSGAITYPYDGLIDEVRAAVISRSAGWVATEYNNQSAPATFVTEGTETDVGGGGICGLISEGFIPTF